MQLPDGWVFRVIISMHRGEGWCGSGRNAMTATGLDGATPVTIFIKLAVILIKRGNCPSPVAAWRQRRASVSERHPLESHHPSNFHSRFYLLPIAETRRGRNSGTGEQVRWSNKWKVTIMGRKNTITCKQRRHCFIYNTNHYQIVSISWY